MGTILADQELLMGLANLLAFFKQPKNDKDFVFHDDTCIDHFISIHFIDHFL